MSLSPLFSMLFAALRAANIHIFFQLLSIYLDKLTIFNRITGTVLLNAARKAVEHGYRVFILPNPEGFRTADFIFERKGVYKMFDLKTIQGKSSASSRLLESIGQTNHVVLNIATNYSPRLLAKDVQFYFEVNKDAREVLIIKGSKALSVSRKFVEGKDYIKMFMKRYQK